MGRAWDSLSPLLVEEKAIMGTWACACDSFSPCLSRKRQSWEHGHALAIPFPPACRGNGYHGIVACVCDSLFPLPVEEKAIVGCLRFPFPPASRGKGFDRTHQSKATSSHDTPRARQVPPIPFFPCLSRKRQSWGGCDSLFPLPVEEKGSMGPSRARQRPRMTPPEHAKSPDCLFPLPVKEKGWILPSS